MVVLQVSWTSMMVGMVLLSTISSGMDVSAVSSLRFDAESAAKNRPVSKVITLLKDMLIQLQKEAEEDEDIYDKLACWCETNDREKTKAIKEAEEKIDMLISKIEELTGLSAQLSTEIKNLEKDIAKDQNSLDQATGIRKKELAEFNEEEKDLLQAITSLKAAIAVLSKHHASLLQMPQQHILGVAATLQHEMKKHASLLEGVLTHSQRRTVAAFLQASKHSYAPQSGEIFGILKQMLETFESNISGSQKDELAAQKAYEELKASKEAEIAAATESKNKKAGELADTDEKLANLKTDLDDTRAKLSADEQYLMMLKEKCEMTDKEWEERTKTRQLEMEAVSKALATLSSDDAHDTFTRTFSFVQEEGASTRAMRFQAVEVLTAVAKKIQSPRLAAIASKVRLDAFTRVKKAIDDMIAQLLKEKADEIKHKDFCVDEFNQNLVSTERKDREKSDLTAKIEDLKMTIETLTKEIAALKAENAEMEVQLKRAGENREKENKEFQLTVADQRATQKLLQAALAVLKGFYEKKAALMQSQQAPAGPPPPPGFKEYKKNENSGGVMGMIEQIIKDAKAMEAEAIRDEEQAGKSYEDFVMDTNASIEAAKKSIVEKSAQKAQAETDLIEAEEALAAAELELEQLANYNLQLHQSCDFIQKNFEIRQTARDEEIEALKQAKAILSGAKFEAFFQIGA
jgi:chromosome segregation ATPase